jgi:hypothetical protein
MTAKALGAMKAVKMTGLADLVGSRVRDSRASEIQASFRYRALNILVTISCKHHSLRHNSERTSMEVTNVVIR